jgi:1-phosphatidylinositol-3-phosphate 5-kinase
VRIDSQQVLLDDNLMELTRGRPFPLKHRAKLYFDKAALNDTEFLSVINVVDYSILVGFDEDNHELVVGIIDYLRQYDFVKRMERMGKSVGMLTGQAEPTIIQPPQYCRRFTSSLERYFMAVPDKFSMG